MSGCQLFTKHSHSIIGQAGEGDLGGLLLRLLLHLPLPPTLHLPALGPGKADLVVFLKHFLHSFLKALAWLGLLKNIIEN